MWKLAEVFSKHRFGFASETTIELLNNISKTSNTLEYVYLAEFMENPVQRETLVTLLTVNPPLSNSYKIFSHLAIRTRMVYHFYIAF